MSEEDVGGGGGLGPHRPAPCPSPGAPAETTSPGTTRHLPRGIIIQLTGTEGDWDSVDDGELIFSLDRDGDFPSLFLPSESHVSQEDQAGLRCPAFHVPLSLSSSGSLGDCGAVSPGFLSPGPGSPAQRPQASLVKSLSDEAELKDNSALRSRPLLSLIKSISSEISCSEPEVSQSKSDSRLNLHLWKQLTQHKARGNGDSRTAPPSPNSTSPTGDVSKGSFFKMELEDTKRKLSEAVQEPLSSMFSKIMREESVSSPKHQSRSQTSNQACSSGARGAGQEAVTDPSGLSDSPVRNALPVFDWPVLRPSGRSYHGMCPVHNSRGDMEICGDGDEIQVAAVEAQRQPPKWPPEPRTRSPPQPQPPLPPLPRTTLLCVALLSYGYFTLPLSSYMSGLALGLAFGFVLGLVLIRLGSFSACCSANVSGAAPDVVAWSRLCIQPSGLKGWMNEIYDYDPETYHPSLTYSVFVTLEASRLRLDYPQCNISRRATYDERIHETTFINSRFYQLAHSKVLLLPCVLARKRLWNPKYPICLQLEGSVSPEEKGGPERSQGEEPTIELANQGQPTKPNQNMPTVLHLFGRTGREKEEWFRHFLLASQSRSKRHSRCASRSGDHPVVRSASLSPPAQGSCGSTRVGSAEDEAPSINIFPSTSNHRGRSQLDYPTYMSRLLAMEQLSPLASPAANSTETSPSTQARCTCDLPEWEGGKTAWANALIGRIFWDFLREKHWVDIVSHKIQKKLSKIRLPYFMNELSLTELDMGSCMPQITSASSAEVDHRGVWLKVKLVYTGALQMTLQTNFNLSRLGKEGIQDTHFLTETGSLGRARSVLTVLADSDEESSSAGSSDEEELLLSEGLSAQCPVGDKGVPAGLDGAASGRTGRKILRFVDKIAKSKYFQKATENEFIKKKFEEMSNTPLLLAVEVQELSGTLVINIPPPPTDRIWYSFCVPPKLDLHVRPKLGEREVTICHVTDWIQKKLQDEFQKVIVLPNMDDIYLPLMHSGMNIPQISQDQNCHSLGSRNSSTESIERIPSEISGANSD